MPKDNQKMTEREIFQLAEAADLLAEYGYTDEADLVARISENEQIMLYSGASTEQRQPQKIYTRRMIEDVAHKQWKNWNLEGYDTAVGGYHGALAELLKALDNNK